MPPSRGGLMFTIRPAPSRSAAAVRPGVTALSSRQIGVASRDCRSASSLRAWPPKGCSSMSRCSSSSSAQGPGGAGS